MTVGMELLINELCQIGLITFYPKRKHQIKGSMDFVVKHIWVQNTTLTSGVIPTSFF